jgi:uncharacterized membrane protein YccC
MMGRLLSGVGADLADGGRLVSRILSTSVLELRELVFDTSRWRQCLMASLVVPLAITMALALDLDSVWWAGISGFMTVLATGAASLQRGILRITATLAGVVVAFVLARWLPYNHLALALFLAFNTFLGTVGMVVSPYGSSWMLATVTVNIVLLAGIDDPLSVPTMAFDRLTEITIGVVASGLVTNLIAPGGTAPPPPPASGWRHLLDDDWPVVLQGLRAAVTVVILLLAWIWLELPSFQQMAITVAIVMAAPGAGGVGVASRHAVAEKALNRVVGCLIGGLAALGCLALSISDFVPWLLMVAVAMWIFMHIQTSRRGVGYVGTQAAMVFIVTLSQGNGPPTSLVPGVDRFVGIIGGLAILTVVSIALWPSVDERHGHV